MRKKAILFVHGFMGTSRQFAPVIRKLRGKTGADLHDLVLPGHEADIESFVGKGPTSWQKAVDGALDRLRGEYDDLVLVGHSMGGLLLIRSAVQCSDKIRQILTISLPLYIKITFRGIQIRIGSMMKNPKNRNARAAKEMCGVFGVTPINSVRLIPNTLGLFRIMKRTREVLPCLTTPLTVINSKKDEIVSARTLRCVEKKNPQAVLLTLREASHFWFPEDENQKIVEKIQGAVDGRCQET